MELLKDRVAIVTGGTGALGRAVNEHFLSHGAKVAGFRKAARPLSPLEFGGHDEQREGLLAR